MERNRAWMYCRVDNSGESSAGMLRMQELCVESYASAHDLEIDGRTLDIGNGLTAESSILEDFNQAVEDQKVDILLLPKLSRLGRNSWAIAQYWHMLCEHGVRICTAVGGEVKRGLITCLLDEACRSAKCGP